MYEMLMLTNLLISEPGCSNGTELMAASLKIPGIISRNAERKDVGFSCFDKNIVVTSY
jgi:hypothetical protein